MSLSILRGFGSKKSLSSKNSSSQLDLSGGGGDGASKSGSPTTDSAHRHPPLSSLRNEIIEPIPNIKNSDLKEPSENAVPQKLTVYQLNKSRFRLGDIQFLITLGTGTFGRVYIVKNKVDEKYYAMKVLKKSEIVRLKQVEHINSEKQILAEINHPFIVNLFCTFHDEKSVYMMLEYIPGGELFSHLRRAGRFPVEVARFYSAEILLAIQYLHSRDIIYRDLKPENLLLDAEGHIKITDFGFAKRVEDKTYTLCGTPEYIAPEIIQSKGHGREVDFWALGVLIYEMLAGYPPFFDDHPFGIYEKILAGKLVFTSSFDALAKDLAKRMLVVDRTRRLGNLRGGADDVKQHKFYRGMDWEALYERRLPAPFRPVINHAGDTSNFERYPEIDLAEEMRPTGEDPHRALFPSF